MLGQVDTITTTGVNRFALTCVVVNLNFKSSNFTITGVKIFIISNSFKRNFFEVICNFIEIV